MNTILTDRPLTVTEAAEYTGFSKAYVYKLCHLNKLPHFKPENGKILFFNAYLIRMLCNINAASFYINFILSENQSTVNTQQEVFNLMI